MKESHEASGATWRKRDMDKCRRLAFKRELEVTKVILTARDRVKVPDEYLGGMKKKRPVTKKTGNTLSNTLSNKLSSTGKIRDENIKTLSSQSSIVNITNNVSNDGRVVMDGLRVQGMDLCMDAISSEVTPLQIARLRKKW